MKRIGVLRGTGFRLEEGLCGGVRGLDFCVVIGGVIVYFIVGDIEV